MLLVAPGNTQFVNRRLIVEFAAKDRLPIMYAFVEAVLAVYTNCGVSSCHCRNARAYTKAAVGQDVAMPYVKCDLHVCFRL
jgi:hypothetical protein